MFAKRYRWSLLSVLLMSGCVNVTEGETTTYSNSLLYILAILAMAVTALVIGIGVMRENIPKPQPKRRKKSRTGKVIKTRPDPKINWSGLISGVVISLVGASILLLGVPSTILAYVKVGPEQVEIRDALWWFAYGPRTYSYQNISHLEKEVRQVRGRRGMRNKTYLHITHIGGVEQIEAAPVHRESWEKLNSTYQQFKQNSGLAMDATSNSVSPKFPAIPGNEELDALALSPVTGMSNDINSRPLPSGESPLTPVKENPFKPLEENPFKPVNDNPFKPVDDNPFKPVDENPFKPAGGSSSAANGLTPVASIGRYEAGHRVSVRGDSGFVVCEITEVYKENQIKVRMSDQSERIVPLAGTIMAASATFARPGEGPGTAIKVDDNLPAGTKVLGQYANKWYPAEIISMQGGRVTITWTDEPPGRHTVPLNWVRLPPN